MEDQYHSCTEPFYSWQRTWRDTEKQLTALTKTFRFLLITCLNPLLLHKLMGETLEKKVYLYNVDIQGSFFLSSYKQSCIFAHK